MNHDFDSLEELIIDKIIEAITASNVDQKTVEWIVNTKLERIAQILVDDATRSELEE